MFTSFKQQERFDCGFVYILLKVMKKIERKPSDHFKAKVQRILYPESNTISSDDDSQNNIEVPDQYEPSTERLAPRSELDNGTELFHRHEKFITKQVTAVRKLHQKGILAVSSKQRVDGLVEKEERPSEKGLNSVRKCISYL